jgi:uridine kinase
MGTLGGSPNPPAKGSVEQSSTSPTRDGSMTGARMVVAVDGLDGSGKSRFAASLAAAICADGRPASLLHVDDFRRPIDFSQLAPEAESTAYYERYFDFVAVSDALSAWVQGPTDGAVLILEGVMVLRAGLPSGAPLIVLEVSAVEARRRILARDQAKGRTPEEIAGRIDRRYFPAQARYRGACDPLAVADLVIDNEEWAHARVVRRGERHLAPTIAAALDRVLGAE